MKNIQYGYTAPDYNMCLTSSMTFTLTVILYIITLVDNRNFQKSDLHIVYNLSSFLLTVTFTVLVHTLLYDVSDIFYQAYSYTKIIEFFIIQQLLLKFLFPVAFKCLRKI